VSSAFSPIPASLSQPAFPRWRDGGAAQAAQWAILALALFGFALPLLAVLADGAGGAIAVATSASFWSATLTSLGIAIVSSALSLALALTIAASRAAMGGRWFRLAVGVPAYAYLAVPAVALSLGAFLFVRELGLAAETAAPLVVIVANALLALPFALATLGPAFDAIVRTRGKLMRSIGISGARQFREVEWPLLAGDIGIVVALAFCFSLGDLGVIALFGTQDFVTLPLYMLRALGAYRTNDAAAVAALMLVLTIAAFVLIPQLFEKLGHART
jgi:thiamine transport system permease protein